jgi:hypothetical protein
MNPGEAGIFIYSAQLQRRGIIMIVVFIKTVLDQRSQRLLLSLGKFLNECTPRGRGSGSLTAYKSKDQ